MDIIKITSITVACLIVIILLRRLSSDYALLASCATNIGITVFSLTILFPVFDYIKELTQGSPVSSLCEIMFKSAGVCFLCSIASEICSDAGEGSLSSRIEFAGKCTLLAYSLPIIKKVFEYATTFLY